MGRRGCGGWGGSQQGKLCLVIGASVVPVASSQGETLHVAPHPFCSPRAVLQEQALPSLGASAVSDSIPQLRGFILTPRWCR